MRLRNKVAIITGSGRGIGREMARLFAEQGAGVVVADIDRSTAERTAGEINARGQEALVVRVDITSPAQVQSMIQETLARFSRIDVLVNNAGVGSNCPFLSMPLEEWEQQLRVNLTGTFICAQAVAQVMARQKAGRIVNVASISGQRRWVRGLRASKAGVIL